MRTTRIAKTVKRLIAPLWLLAACIIIGCAIGASYAKADTPAEQYAAQYGGVVCAVLDDYPSGSGVWGIVQAIVGEGYLSYFEAGQVVGMSVSNFCPEHQPSLDEFVAMVGRKQVAVA
jgi:hypothetical protein